MTRERKKQVLTPDPGMPEPARRRLGLPHHPRQLRMIASCHEVRIEQAFELVTADGVVHMLDPEGDPVRLGPALGCARTVVMTADAAEDGRLEMVFGDRSAIRVPVSEEYEGWTPAGPGGLRIVAGPGGKVTVWSGERR